MRYLLDSHVLLWYNDPNGPLSASKRDVLDQAETLFVSVASIWELTLKRSVGKLDFSKPFSALIEEYSMDVLPVRLEHVAETEQLPRLHKDPFDHLLVAQAIVEGLVLVTHDDVVARYPVPVFRV
jgi:PIN domain nuclease of toxin-antitoxin system